MLDHNKKLTSSYSVIQGGSLLNTAINKLPFELHIPGYQYCGPGTKLKQRLERGDPGINLLDQACKEHDISYSKSQDLSVRNKADLELAEKSWQRVKAKDSKLGERINALLITNIMKTKAKLGMGIKKSTGKNKRKNQNNLKNLISKTRSAIKSKKPKSIQSAIKLAITTAKNIIKSRPIGDSTTRIIPIPKSGGVLPFLVPLFAGLSAVGALAGGASGIVKAVNEAKDARKQLEENARHNRKMEAIAIGKGLFLKPYRKGLGLYLNPKNY